MILMLAFLLACPLGTQETDDPLKSLLREAARAEAEERFGEAVTLLRGIIEADPENVRALNRLAHIYATASDSEFFSGRLAVEFALMALDRAPDDTSIIETLAEGYFVQGQFERAITELRRCIARAPKDTRFYLKLQRYALKWNKRLDTLPAASSAERGAALFFLGQAAYRLGEHEKAVTYLRKSFQIDGSPRAAAAYLSMALLALDEPYEAMEVLNTTELDIANDPVLLQVMGRASLKMNEAKNAAAYFVKALDLDPAIDNLKGDLGKAYLMMGENERAATVLQEALQAVDAGTFRNDLQRSELYVLAGRALERLERIDEALMMYYQAAAIGFPGSKGEDHLKKLFAEKYENRGSLREFLARDLWPDAVLFEPVTNDTSMSGKGGASWIDFDRDGDPDLLVGCARLLRNEGRGRFRDVTARARLDAPAGSGGISADFNADGYPDIFVFSIDGRTPCRMMKNCGNGVFIDVINYSGLPRDASNAVSGALGDLNGDGLPDLFLICVEQGGGNRRSGRLFFNRGIGRFREGTEEAGISSHGADAGSAAIITDFDNDGDMDLFVANSELEPNTLWRNDGSGRFIDCAVKVGVSGRDVRGAFGNSVGALAGDLDGDGDQDMFVANVAPILDAAIADRSQVLINSGRPDFIFHDAFGDSGIRYDQYHTHATLGDIDNDGDLDLFITEERQDRLSRLYANDGAGRFVDVTWLAGLKVPNAAGIAMADYDGDGDLDLFVSGEGGTLIENRGNENHWIAFRLQPKEGIVSDISSRVTVHAGGRSMERETETGGGTGFQNGSTHHFGLGPFRDKVSASIRWSDGRSLFLENLKVDRIHTVRDKGK